MASKLSKKQIGFVKDYAKTGNGVLAARNNYDVKNDNVAAMIASENIRKPNVKEAILSIADRIPEELLVKTHLEGLESYKMEGENVEPDFSTRHKYLESAYKLKNLYPKENQNVAVQLNIGNVKGKYN